MKSIFRMMTHPTVANVALAIALGLLMSIRF